MIRGLDKEKIKSISKIKGEDKKILDFRLAAYDEFNNLAMPFFGPDLKGLNFDDVIYYKKSEDGLSSSWSDIHDSTFCEFRDLGVVDAEKHMDGMGVQHDSEVIYHNMRRELEDKNVVFTSIEDGLKNYPDIAFKYFSKIVKTGENKFTALNSAVFSGGSFIYIPPNTKLDRPLQSYFRIASEEMGQFERTLIIVDDNSELHYIEGCTAPNYTASSLHAAIVEIYVGKNSKCRYTTIQNWSENVYNLVTKRALVEENASMTWVDGNIGSYKTMKYPSCVLKGDNSEGVCITISTAKTGQHQDSGAGMIHVGKNTKSKIISKSIASGTGAANYRGKVKIVKEAEGSDAFIKCDSLILDKNAISNAYPNNEVFNSSSTLEHEATVKKLDEEKLFYLMTRGLSRKEAEEAIILGFIDDFRSELPMEYAVELNSLLKNYF